MLLLTFSIVAAAILLSIDGAFKLLCCLVLAVASFVGFVTLVGFLVATPGLLAGWFGVSDLAVTAIMVKTAIIAAALIYTGGRG